MIVTSNAVDLRQATKASYFLHGKYEKKEEDA
jgi:hypothetical protein